MSACTRRPDVGAFLADPCPACGHTNALHPSPSNPALTACVVCELLAMREESP